MPFDDDYGDIDNLSKKNGLKNISTQKSIFDNNVKKTSQNDFDSSVKNMEEKKINYKQRTSDLAIQFKKLIEDKTLLDNKNIFSKEMEKEVLLNIIQLASEVNNDANESEGIGSLSWIAQLFKTVLYQRDRINNLEYALTQLEKNYLKIKNQNQIDTSKINE